MTFRGHDADDGWRFVIVLQYDADESKIHLLRLRASMDD